MKGKLGDKQRLQHILEAISELENYTKGASQESFSENSMMRFACIKQIEIISEAANNISEELRSVFPAIEWEQIIALRHILVHEYFGVDAEIIWQIISKDIPKLKTEIEKILASDQ